MKREYYFFGLDGHNVKILFDDEQTVKELVCHALAEYDYYEPLGESVLTVYDSSKYHFVTNPSNKCKDEISFDQIGNVLCIGYFLDNAFYFAEGGWGHHMIGMDAKKRIKDPIAIEIRFEDFKNTVVINGNISLGSIFDYLLKGTYISDKEVIFHISERNDFGVSETLGGAVYDMRKTKDRNLLLKEIKMVDSICIIKSC